MERSSIKNVVFDVGNVIVRWAPQEIVRLTFGDVESPEQLGSTIFRSDTWLDLNKGLLTEAEAKQHYQQTIGLSELECERLFYYVKQTQILLFGSVDLLQRVKAAGYGVYALTDNVTEIVEYLQSTYSFWEHFDGATVSAELGLLKPQPEIYHSLLDQHALSASETVFIDDMPHNVRGAESVGITAIQFENAAQCEQALRALGLSF
ncbi:HAD family hydrolase [Photobacterium ganghwense]|uniref:HAD family hydrolase n=1 Tax=Photobacterium ganghwense TaxID=320778 RepID=UPI001A8D36E3|nr:HAD family phosphatase [Photobacterium ganghwense]QSV16958.1 HAD family phosphatase [Photobacterium ganghwense]